MSSMTSQPECRLPAALTLLVGVGERGGQVIGGLESQPPFSADDGDPSRHLGRMTLLSDDGPSRRGESCDSASVRDLGRFLAGEVVGRLEKMLAHTSVDDARAHEGERTLSEQSTKCLVAIIADVGEDVVRDVIRPLLRSIEDLAAERLSPIFAPHRGHAFKNLVILPLLATPHVPSAGAGPEISRCIEELYGDVKARDTERRLISTLYLVETVSELSVLEPRDLNTLLESFCLFLAEGLASCGDNLAAKGAGRAISFGAETLEKTLHASAPTRPLGTFSVARAETRTDRIGEYAKCRLALEILTQIQDVPMESEGIAERNEAEADANKLLEPLPKLALDEEALERVAGLKLARPENPPWHRFKEEVSETYFPDRGNPTLDDDRPRGDDEGWLKDKADHFLSGWRRMMRIDFDGLAEELREKISGWELGGDKEDSGLRKRFRKDVDSRLLPEDGGRLPTISSYHQALDRADTLKRGLAGELQQAVATRDGCRIDKDPSLEPLRAAHADLLCANRAVPSVPLLAGVCILLVLSVFFLLPVPLRNYGLARGLEEGVWHFLIVQYPSIFVGLLASAVCGLVGSIVFYRRYRVARDALDKLWQRADDLVDGETGSILSFVLTRLRYTWHVAKVGALARVFDSVEDDQRKMRDIERAITGAKDRYRQRLADLGVELGANGVFDTSKLFDDMHRPLHWPLIDADIVSSFVEQGAQLRPEAILQRAQTEGRIYSEWRRQLPFLDDRPLDRALDRVVDSVVPEPPWTSETLKENISGNVESFARAQRRSLPLALAVGESSRDSQLVTVVDGLVVPREMSRDVLTDPDFFRDIDAAEFFEDAPVRRVYHVRLINGIDLATVRWMREENRGSRKRSPAKTKSGRDDATPTEEQS